MIGYRKMSIDLVLPNLQDFGDSLLASCYVHVDCFRKSVTFHIYDKLKFSFEGKHVIRPLTIVYDLSFMD